KYRNNVIECDHGKLKRIIGATLGFKSMKTAYATIKGIEVMRALRKGQASAFYYGDPLGEMRLVREGANKRGNSSRLTQSFHFFMFEPIFSPVNALNQPI
ncbi:transposase, partial [Escherichia coli]|uniref:transposase n=2 Tax=Escherichia coli TaxID=562 RepID=UPI0020421B33